MSSIIDLSGLAISDRTDPILVPNTRGGGTAINGLEQIVSPLTSIWKWRIVLPINNAGRARSWRAINAQLDGRFNMLKVGVCDQYRIGRRDVGATYPDGQVPHSDDTPFSDGSAYALSQPSSAVQIAATRGATSVRLLASDFAGGMTAGVFFSIDDYLYVVTDWTDDGTNIDVTFKPGLRAPVEEGATADFAAKAVWVLDSDDAGKMALRLGRFGEVELNLTEALYRAM